MRFTWPSVSAAVLISADGQSEVDAGVVVAASSELESPPHAPSMRSEASANAATFDMDFVFSRELRMSLTLPYADFHRATSR
jgi:hypothetical protein